MEEKKTKDDDSDEEATDRSQTKFFTLRKESLGGWTTTVGWNTTVRRECYVNCISALENSPLLL